MVSLSHLRIDCFLPTGAGARAAASSRQLLSRLQRGGVETATDYRDAGWASQGRALSGGGEQLTQLMMRGAPSRGCGRGAESMQGNLELGAMLLLQLLGPCEHPCERVECGVRRCESAEKRASGGARERKRDSRERQTSERERE